jgi:regulatory protein
VIQGLDEALSLAYRYLNPRDRTTLEVQSHLEQKGVQTALAGQAVRLLVEQGYLDDERFARLFVQEKRQLEQWGAERIRRGLSARGIDRELIGATLAEELSVGEGETLTSELDRALALLRRRFPSPPRKRQERDRALGVLIRKGYDPELALDALAAYGRDP